MLSHHSSIVSALRRVSRVALLSLTLLTLGLNAVAYAEPFAYIANFNSDNISVLDTATNTVVATVPVPVGSIPTGVAVTPNGALVYVTNR
jgi:YVTN family beta-propeller protein